MPSPTSSTQVFRPGRALPYVGGFVAGGLALSLLYAGTGVGIPCPFRVLTGWSCPFCGGTRMGAALLHGDLVTAFAVSPVSFVLVAVVGALGLGWSLEAAGGPALRWPAGVARRWARVTPWQWLTIGISIVVAATLVRNLV